MSGGLIDVHSQSAGSIRVMLADFIALLTAVGGSQSLSTLCLLKVTQKITVNVIL